ncbi:MAG TPA: acyl-CoA thioesterase/BAAT N-terminal domain-containing protein, partial [Acidimicrobiales bacterium]|nr:acyl-CoA thioesterase/BAAT N-terminal domain-containing protein [Acidimicrobiales bacterium]
MAARVIGVQPGRVVRVQARVADALGHVFGSWADYRAGPAGEVEPAVDAPLVGTYGGVDPFGLWWSMSGPADVGFVNDLAPVHTELSVESDGTVVASAGPSRDWLGYGVARAAVGDDVPGDLFLPARRPAPGVVVLGGSEGGRRPALGTAALLAGHGLAALALAYFGEAGLPPTLVEVPVEAVGRALDRLAAHPAVSGRALGIVGSSRGGELALLAAATFPLVGAVVGWAASAVLWAGLGAGARVGGPAWTWADEALRFATPVAEK